MFKGSQKDGYAFIYQDSITAIDGFQTLQYSLLRILKHLYPFANFSEIWFAWNQIYIHRIEHIDPLLFNSRFLAVYSLDLLRVKFGLAVVVIQTIYFLLDVI